MELSEDGIVAADSDQRIVSFSAGAERMTGYSAGNVIGQPLSLLVPERFRRAHAGLVRGFERSAEASRRMGERSTVAVRRQDGSEFDAEISITRSGRPGSALLVAVFRDVTRRNQTERALKESEGRLKKAQRAAGVGDWEWRARGQRLIGSEQVSAILGLPADAPFGLRAVLRRVHRDDRGELKATLAAALRTGAAYEVELRIVRPDGAVRWVYGRVEPLFDQAGHPAGLSGTLQDVTTRVAAAERLRAALDEAQAATKSKSAFLANISHELRTPLNAILGFAEMMRLEVYGPPGHPKYAEYAADITDSAQFLVAMIGDVLEMARIDATRLEITREPTDVAALIDGCVRLIADRCRRAGLGIATDIVPLPPVPLDARRIKQAVTNLLSNAIKFTPAGGRVGVRAWRDGDQLAIEVRDTGCGMTDDEIAVALTPFGQVASPMTRAHSGTGLGLPIAQSLVALHGGTLEIASARDRGTAVTIRLPLVAGGLLPPTPGRPLARRK